MNKTTSNAFSSVKGPSSFIKDSNFNGVNISKAATTSLGLGPLVYVQSVAKLKKNIKSPNKR